MLELCILKILSQGTNYDIKIILIYNGHRGFDRLLQWSKMRFGAKIICHQEMKIGLSSARNKGLKESDDEWLIYIDDDVLIGKNYLRRIQEKIQGNQKLDCFGGPYYAKFVNGRPKWLPPDFGSKVWPLKEAGELKLGYLSGGNFIIKRESLLAVGGFPEHYGMRGKRLGYGEEDFVQDKLRSSGGKIWFYPDLGVDHIIHPRKQRLPWHMQHAYVSGRDQLMPSSYAHRFFRLIHAVAASFFKRLPVGLFKIICHKSYYWQNLVLDTTTPILYAYGLLFAKNRLKRDES